MDHSPVVNVAAHGAARSPRAAPAEAPDTLPAPVATVLLPFPRQYGRELLMLGAEGQGEAGYTFSAGLGNLQITDAHLSS